MAHPARALPRIMGRRARGWRYTRRRPAADPPVVRRPNPGRSAGADGRGSDRPGYDIVRETWKPILGEAEFDSKWNRVLHDGLLAGSELPEVVPDLKGTRSRSSAAFAPRRFGEQAASRSPGGLEVVFLPSPALHDGRFANDGWLQELPDPLTKLTWDNPALVSPKTAQTLGLAGEELVRLDYAGRSLDLPLWILPGMADGVVALTLGYGRSARGTDRVRSRVRHLHGSKPPRHLASTAAPHSAGSDASTSSRRRRTTAAWRGAPSSASPR